MRHDLFSNSENFTNEKNFKFTRIVEFYLSNTQATDKSDKDNTNFNLKMGNAFLCGLKGNRKNEKQDLDKDRNEAIANLSPCETHRLLTGTAALVNATKTGHVNCVKALILTGADVNVPDTLGHTAHNYHHFKNSKKHCECIKLVLQAGADVNSTNNYGGTALHTAAESSHDECLRHILLSGADVNKMDNEGRSALALAALKGRRKCVNLLLTWGADVNISVMFGNTALINAARSGYYKLVDILIQAGADVNEANAKGFTPLMLCPGAFVFFQRSGVLCLQVLLSAGAHVNKTNGLGQNALEYYLTECRRPRKNVMILLYAAGEKVNPVTVGTPEWFRKQSGQNSFDIDTYLELTESKLCLQHMCRDTIRTRLIGINPHLHLL